MLFNAEYPGIAVPGLYAAPPQPAQNLKCAKCGREMKPGERFLKTADGQFFCSDKCFQASLPVCSVCGKILSAGYYKGKDGKKLYCSEKCLSTTWPQCSLCGKKVPEGVMITGSTGRMFFCNSCAEKPKCFCCDMPGPCKKLNDGRYICPECDKTSVMEEKEVISVANEVRRKMKDKLKMSTEHAIEFRVVDVNELARATAEKQEGIELGLFRYEVTNEKTVSTRTTLLGGTVSKVEDEKISRKYMVFLLYGMTRDKLVEVAAHELAHDWMQVNYPNIGDLKVREGFAEYVASRVNSAYGRDFMNKRMQENPSDAYGGGYRFIAAIAKKGEDDLSAFLGKYNKDSGRK
ncbi:MAG: LIM domain-containing protein [Victivallales bacterium]